MKDKECGRARTLKLCKSLDSSGALPLAVHGYAEMLACGWADPECNMLSGTYSTVTCSERGKIVGLICFGEWNHPQRWWVYFGFVAKERRGTGVYRAMWDMLLRAAAKKKVRTIGGATSVANVPMNEVMKALGRIARSTTYEFTVPVQP